MSFSSTDSDLEDERIVNDTSSSSESYGSDVSVNNLPSTTYKCHNGIEWVSVPPSTSRTRQHNIVTQRCGLGDGVNFENPKGAFQQFFDTDILEEII